MDDRTKELVEGSVQKSQIWQEVTNKTKAAYTATLDGLDDKQLIAEAEQRVDEIIPLILDIAPSENEPVVEGKFQALFSTLVRRGLAGKDDPEIRRTCARVCLTTKLLEALREVYGVNGHSMSRRLDESENNFRSAYNIIQQEGDVFGPNTKDAYNILAQTAIRTVGWASPRYNLPKFAV